MYVPLRVEAVIEATDARRLEPRVHLARRGRRTCDACTKRLSACTYARALATRMSVSAARPMYEPPSASMRIVTSPCASMPSVTDFTLNSVSSFWTCDHAVDRLVDRVHRPGADGRVLVRDAVGADQPHRRRRRAVVARRDLHEVERSRPRPPPSRSARPRIASRSRSSTSSLRSATSLKASKTRSNSSSVRLHAEVIEARAQPVAPGHLRQHDRRARRHADCRRGP